MKTCFSRRRPNIRTTPGVAFLSLVLGALALPPHLAEAQTRIINLPEDMCNVLGEQPLNQRILSDVRNRANFGDILAYVEANCANLTGLLIGPTGTIATPGGGGDGGGNGGTNGGANGGSENGGTGNGGGENGGSANGGTSNGGTGGPITGEPDDLGSLPGFDPDDFPDVDRGD